MRVRIARALAVTGGVLLAVRTVGAVDAQDCDRWITALGNETAGAAPKADRGALLDDLHSAARQGRDGQVAGAKRDVAKFQEKVKALAAKQKLGGVEGKRLTTLSETVRRCLDRAR